jgi:hypothetical protein
MPSPFQSINFLSINDFLGYLPPVELAITEALRLIILDCIPEAKERLAYNVPFYYRRSRICFIWPGSVPWGKKEKRGVELGFCRGHLLTDSSYLDKGARKEVYVKTFYDVKEIDRDAIRQLLYEAAVIDEDLYRKKKPQKH